MNKYINFIFFLLVSFSVKAQTIDKLETKNGFKDFKLGDNYSQWQKDLVFISENKIGEKQYDYKGNCCPQIFTDDIEKIRLTFNKDNKLNEIYLKLIPTSYKYNFDPYKELKKNFFLLFGSPTCSGRVKSSINSNNCNCAGDVLLCDEWQSANVLLLIEFYSGKTESRNLITISSKEQLKSGF